MIGPASELDESPRGLIGLLIRREGITGSSRVAYEFDCIDDRISRDSLSESLSDPSRTKEFSLVQIVTGPKRLKRKFGRNPEEGDWYHITISRRWLRGPATYKSPLSPLGYEDITRVGLIDLDYLGPLDEPDPQPVGAATNATKTNARKIARDVKLPEGAIRDGWGHLTPKYKAPEKLSRIIVHDVGQGSLVSILGGNDETVAYFDAGWPIGFNGKTRPAPPELPTSPNAIVVLSHWDMDHLNGYHRLAGLKALHWIAPYQDVGPGQLKIATELHQSERLFLQRTTTIPALLPFGMMFHSSGATRNDSGVVLHVDIGDKEGLLVGDAAYPAMHEHLQDWPHDFLLITHHGAHCGDTVPVAKEPMKSRAVISVGLGNRYKHPSAEAVAAHQVKWDVQATMAWNGKPRGPKYYP